MTAVARIGPFCQRQLPVQVEVRQGAAEGGPVADRSPPSTRDRFSTLIRPAAAKANSARNCGIVIVSSTRAIDRAEIATSRRDVINSRSVVTSADTLSAH